MNNNKDYVIELINDRLRYGTDEQLELILIFVDNYLRKPGSMK